MENITVNLSAYPTAIGVEVNDWQPVVNVAYVPATLAGLSAAPLGHTHSYNELEDLPQTLTGDYNTLINVPSEFLPSYHWHDINDITGLGDMATQNNSSVTITGGTITLNNPFLGPVGSATTPGFSFSGDTNTGIFRVASDALGFSAGGSKIATISTSGLDLSGSLTGQGSDNKLALQLYGGPTDYGRIKTRKTTPFDCFDEWYPYGAYMGQSSGGVSGTGGANYGGAYVAQVGSSANGWGRSIISLLTTRAPGAGGNNGLCSVPLAVSLVGTFTIDNTNPLNQGKIRIIVGDTSTTTDAPPAATSSALSARGFGAEFYYSNANARQEIRLFAHNGTTYVQSSGVAFGSSGNWAGITSLVLASDGAGTIKLFGYASSSHSNPAQLPLLLTLTGGPTDSTYGKNGTITVTAQADGTYVSNNMYQHLRSKISLNSVL